VNTGRSDPLDVAVALQIGRGTALKTRQNLGWAIGYNVIALAIAAVFEPDFGLVLWPDRRTVDVGLEFPRGGERRPAQALRLPSPAHERPRRPLTSQSSLCDLFQAAIRRLRRDRAATRK